ncbi:MAG: TIGR03915 family putative DNA repair protein [Eubacteriaceae bacterium]
MIIEYENTFDGLLSALYTYYTCKDITIINSSSMPGLLEADKHDTNFENAKKFGNRIINKFGIAAYENIYFAFIYNATDKESSIIQYINFLINKNNNNNMAYFKITKYRKEILNTIMRFQGFLRFSDIYGIMYAKYEPEYDITFLLSDYFKERLLGSDFIIHDLKRDLLLFYKNQEKVIIKINKEIFADYDDANEQYIQNLFKTYFESASIKERENYKLQRNMFPLKYRHHALEFEKG